MRAVQQDVCLEARLREALKAADEKERVIADLKSTLDNRLALINQLGDELKGLCARSDSVPRPDSPYPTHSSSTHASPSVSCDVSRSLAADLESPATRRHLRSADERACHPQLEIRARRPPRADQSPRL